MRWLLMYYVILFGAASAVELVFVTDVETDPYKGLNYDEPNVYYMDEEDKPKKCSCFSCTWER